MAAKSEVNFETMTVEDKVKYNYEHGNGQGLAPSIQDIARAYRLTVEEVLKILDHDEMLTVETQGDLIDPEEAGPSTTIKHGEQHKVNYSTN
jgi:hypothetical protein